MAGILLTELLEAWRSVIGADFEGYANHCHRMVCLCRTLRRCSDDEQQKIAIAACFHAIGLWTGKTLDYLPPSSLRRWTA